MPTVKLRSFRRPDFCFPRAQQGLVPVAVPPYSESYSKASSSVGGRGSSREGCTSLLPGIPIHCSSPSVRECRTHISDHVRPCLQLGQLPIAFRIKPCSPLYGGPTCLTPRNLFPRCRAPPASGSTSSWKPSPETPSSLPCGSHFPFTCALQVPSTLSPDPRTVSYCLTSGITQCLLFFNTLKLLCAGLCLV